MQIACPNCATSYQVDTSSIGGAGRSVRCARCQSTWFVSPSALTIVGTSEAALTDLAVAAFRAELGPQTLPSLPPPPDANAIPAIVAPSIAAADDIVVVPSDAAANWSLAAADSKPALPMVVIETDPQSETARPRPVDLDAGHPPIVIDDLPAKVDAPPLAAVLPETDALSPDANADAKPMAPVRPRRTFRRLPPLKPPSNKRTVGVIVVLLAIIGALIGLRAEVVRRAPQMASLYATIGLPVNVRSMVFTDIRLASETRDGVPVLLVEGSIVSTSAAPTKIPELRFALRNDAGAEVYSWTAAAPQPELAPFETLAFHSRLASPPGDSRDVVVRFVNRNDVVADVR